MDTEEKPPPLWVRLCGMLVGAIGAALGTAILFILGVILGATSGGGNLPLFMIVTGVIGASIGFALPRQTLNTLLIFLPNTGE